MNLSDEMKSVHFLLSECFPQGKMLTHLDPLEFVGHPKGNVYFILGNCENKLDVDCKVLEYFSRAAYKTEPYYTEANNKKFHNYFLDGINRYFGSNFTETDIEIVYTYLGNCCHHQRTVDFVRSGFDMSVLNPNYQKDIETERDL